MQTQFQMSAKYLVQVMLPSLHDQFRLGKKVCQPHNVQCSEKIKSLPHPELLRPRLGLN